MREREDQLRELVLLGMIVRYLQQMHPSAKSWLMSRMLADGVRPLG